MSDIRELYQELILDHGRHPRSFGCLDQPCCIKEGYNPLCGDRLRLSVKLENQTVVDALFDGEGCAISIASASLMLQAVKGKSVEEALHLFSSFQDMLHNDNDNADLGKLNALAGVKQFPMRVKCATLAWHTLKAVLNNDEKEVTTE